MEASHIDSCREYLVQQREEEPTLGNSDTKSGPAAVNYQTHGRFNHQQIGKRKIYGNLQNETYYGTKSNPVLLASNMNIEENEVISPNDYQAALPLQIGRLKMDHNIQEGNISEKGSEFTQITQKNKQFLAQTMAMDSSASRMIVHQPNINSNLQDYDGQTFGHEKMNSVRQLHNRKSSLISGKQNYESDIDEIMTHEPQFKSQLVLQETFGHDTSKYGTIGEMVIDKSSNTNNTALARKQPGMITDGDYSQSTETVHYQLGMHAIGSMSQLNGVQNRVERMKPNNSAATGITMIAYKQSSDLKPNGKSEKQQTQPWLKSIDGSLPASLLNNPRGGIAETTQIGKYPQQVKDAELQIISLQTQDQRPIVVDDQLQHRNIAVGTQTSNFEATEVIRNSLFGNGDNQFSEMQEQQISTRKMSEIVAEQKHDDNHYSSDEEKPHRQIMSNHPIMSSNLSKLNEDELISRIPGTGYEPDESGSRIIIKSIADQSSQMNYFEERSIDLRKPKRIEEIEQIQTRDSHNTKFRSINCFESKNFQRNNVHYLTAQQTQKRSFRTDEELEIQAIINFILNQVDSKIDLIEKRKHHSQYTPQSYSGVDGREMKRNSTIEELEQENDDNTIANHIAQECLSSSDELNHIDELNQQLSIVSRPEIHKEETIQRQHMPSKKEATKKEDLTQNTTLFQIEANVKHAKPIKRQSRPANIIPELPIIAEKPRESENQTPTKPAGLTNRNRSEANMKSNTLKTVNPPFMKNVQASSYFPDPNLRPTSPHIAHRYSSKPTNMATVSNPDGVFRHNIMSVPQSQKSRVLQNSLEQRLQESSIETHQTQDQLIKDKLKWLRVQNNNRPFYQADLFASNGQLQLSRHMLQSYRQSLDQQEAQYPQLRLSMKVSDNFDVKQFVMNQFQKYKKQLNGSDQSSLPNLASHNFQNRQHGNKISGPWNDPSKRFQNMPSSFNSGAYFNNIRNPKALNQVGRHPRMSESLEQPNPERPNYYFDNPLDSSRENQEFNLQKFVNQKRNSSKGSNDSQDALMGLFDQRGELDIERAFHLVQQIRQAHGKQYMSDHYITQHLLPLPTAKDANQSFAERLSTYKWIQVMRFMKRNPNILKQLVALKEQTYQQYLSEHYNKRQRSHNTNDETQPSLEKKSIERLEEARQKHIPLPGSKMSQYQRPGVRDPNLQQALMRRMLNQAVIQDDHNIRALPSQRQFIRKQIKKQRSPAEREQQYSVQPTIDYSIGQKNKKSKPEVRHKNNHSVEPHNSSIDSSKKHSPPNRHAQNYGCHPPQQPIKPKQSIKDKLKKGFSPPKGIQNLRQSHNSPQKELVIYRRHRQKEDEEIQNAYFNAKIVVDKTGDAEPQLPSGLSEIIKHKSHGKIAVTSQDVNRVLSSNAVGHRNQYLSQQHSKLKILNQPVMSEQLINEQQRIKSQIGPNLYQSAENRPTDSNQHLKQFEIYNLQNKKVRNAALPLSIEQVLQSQSQDYGNTYEFTPQYEILQDQSINEGSPEPTKQMPPPPRGQDRMMENKTRAGNKNSQNMTQVVGQRKNKSHYNGGGITPIPGLRGKSDQSSV